MSNICSVNVIRDFFSISGNFIRHKHRWSKSEMVFYVFIKKSFDQSQRIFKREKNIKKNSELCKHAQCFNEIFPKLAVIGV